MFPQYTKEFLQDIADTSLTLEDAIDKVLDNMQVNQKETGIHKYYYY